MTSFLHPCPHCQRHIRTDESHCPFCQSAVAGAFDEVPSPRLPTRRLSRAALLTLGTMAASTPLSACAGDDGDGDNTGGTGGMGATTDGEGSGGDDTSTGPVYGIAPRAERMA